jgi:hypothetical protein
MSKKLFIAIDNGVSGSIACVGERTFFAKTPVISVFKYTKKSSKVSRLLVPEFKEMLLEITTGYTPDEIIISLERPMVNPQRFAASISAMRCWEATLICLEELGLPYSYIDSKEWQKVVLPKGIKGSTELKKASLQVGNRLFPEYKDIKHPDRDALMISEYLRISYGR